MDFDRINVFASRNNQLVAAEVYINGDLVGVTGIGGCWDVSGLTGIKVPVDELDIMVKEGGQSITLEEFIPDGDPWTSETIIFNFDTGLAMPLKVPRR